MSKRQEQAIKIKMSGGRAYSDDFNHVLVNCGGTEYGYDLACAIQLRADLDRAIEKAATPNERM